MKTNKNLKAEIEYKIASDLGEGAIWNYQTQELYWIDIEKKTLNIYNPEKKANRIINMSSRIGTVVPIDTNEVLSALEDGVYKTNLKTGRSKLFVDMSDELKDSRLNDGKCDPSGRFWVGSMHLKQKEGHAKLFNINNKSELQMKIDSVTISNGIVWTSDKTKMYYIDTPTSEIKGYEYDNKTGQISNGKVVVKIPEALGFPDGMTIDENNMLWVAMWNGNAVIQFNPNTGNVIQKVEVPAHNITSCAFGGKDLNMLYITSARVDMTEEELEKYPLSGSVFKVNLGVKGVKSSFYKAH
ncbi:SMP-30/gluconolactonase/LRE family protein [uncultured Algibacter sp.]|uniref:SMP-30/gluconolactonase/LRE family protein n=1 Tax=uncultured Algibacter sp. TaxID=298659 RepID=UPI00260F20E9|nr:SMP-30/gluconolactonase/LRE family protein [uncultured Algibacter sp.]